MEWKILRWYCCKHPISQIGRQILKYLSNLLTLSKIADFSKLLFLQSQNRVVDLESETTVQDPFVLQIDLSNSQKHTLNIQRQNWKNFQVQVIYGGRANFNIRIDENWKTEGLGGLLIKSKNLVFCDFVKIRK